MDSAGGKHIRYRIGSVFETAWQMRGMERFLMDLALEPQIPQYILERIAEIHLENTRRVIHAAGDRLDMLYFYDDVATQSSLLVSLDMWKEYIQPLHARLAELARDNGMPMMYHCDGALFPLIPELVAMGIGVLNPIQLDAIGVPPERLKADFGADLAFHGGLDIMELLPKGTADQIRGEVRRLIGILGAGGGYILCSSHHIQPNTPVANVLAAYEPELRGIRAEKP
jgi:uroporphyrinogen decarboxylase